MSAVGTLRTYQPIRRMSVVGGKEDITPDIPLCRSVARCGRSKYIYVNLT